ncbi:pla2g4a, partial [Symbiodinium necroappetens]
VAAAYNLINRDTGVLGDVSDPYVVAQVGSMTQQTPVINNELNPVWQENNQFSFNIVDHSADRYLELKVMNSNVMKDDSLGSIRVDTRSIDPGQ